MTLGVTFSSNKVSVFQITGINTRQIGGHLRRESAALSFPANNELLNHYNSRAIKIYNKIFAIHSSSTAIGALRIYEFDKDGYYSDISSLLGLFNEGEIITGSNSSATAIILDNSITGDDFVTMKNISGTFQIGETITGTNSSATATLDTIPRQGGDLSFAGEWKVAHISNVVALDDIASISGLFSLNSGGATKASGFFINSSHQVKSLDYDPDSDLWTTSVTLATLGVATYKLSRAKIIGTTIYVSYSIDNTTEFVNYISYAPSTQSIGTSSFLVNRNYGNDSGVSPGNDIVEYKSRIFSISGGAPGSTVDQTMLLELSGGSWVTVFNTVISSTNEAIATSSNQGTCLYVIKNIMYALYPTTNVSALIVWNCMRVHINSNNDIVVSTQAPDPIANSSDQGRFAEFFYTQGLRTTISTDNNNRWKSNIDAKINDPDGIQRALLYNMHTGLGNSTSLYEHLGVVDLSLTYTWNGTTTVTASGDPVVTDSLSVGDWIGLGSDQRIFEISAFATPSGGPANSTITILDTFVIGIPSGSTTTIKERKINPIAYGGDIAQMAISESVTYDGSLEFSTVSNSLDIVITGVAPALGGETINFKLFSNSGSTTVDVEFFFGANLNGTPDSKCTLSSPSSGVINGKTIEGLSADNGATTYTVVWNSSTDGALDSETRMIIGKVFE